MYDVIIIGAGPAGLFCAYELCKKNLRILIIDKGDEPLKRLNNSRSYESIMCGVGGSGCMSDGKLNLDPFIGGNLTEFVSYEESLKLINEVDSTLISFGAPEEYVSIPEKGKEIAKNALKNGVYLYLIKQKHIGSDKLPYIINNFYRYLISKGVNFMLNREVIDLIVEDNKAKGVILKGNEKLLSRFVVLCPGRIGHKFFMNLCKKYNIKTRYLPIDIGVRIETRNEIMEDLTKIFYDPKIYIRTKTYDDLVRTFCTNPSGFVVKETYDGLIGVNGHAFRDKKSNNTNFAFLVTVNLTKPLENTIEYGRAIAKLATTIGGGKPILQRLGDLIKGRRSTKERIERSFIVPTLEEYTEGDISMALPSRIITDIIEGLEKLDNVIKGIFSENTLIYAPEIKYYSLRAEVKDMESSLKNLFCAGDGCGLSRDIVNASVTGILAGRGIIKKLNEKSSE